MPRVEISILQSNKKRLLSGCFNIAGYYALQHKRRSEGDLQVLLSRYSPAWYGLGKISPGLQMGYCTYCLLAPNSLAMVFYSMVPSLYLLRGISLFPQVSSPWSLPFAYVLIAKYAYSLAEFLWSCGTVLGWRNDQRIWLYKRTTSYLFAFVDTMLGTSFPMFTIWATLATLNLISLVWVSKRVVTGAGVGGFDSMPLQYILCGVLVLINLPLYSALFFRKDKGKMSKFYHS
ncbi:hypothetical protein Vadar_001053 [Vaccinium darrowii]|uniref:Uncharacterized protein n=1 Tax=Vaccinium darrowii TaxID=229202 RepID=A0ACB7XMM5_9ERIC|nr:hypothetical protein Vadar_001053 [Vaccinium darrowii]